MKMYKVLDKEGKSCNGGNAKWSLPKKLDGGTWQPGKWMLPIEGELSMCKNGYHLVRIDNLLEWLGERIYEVEYKGEREEGKNKVVVRECRLTRECEGWNEKTARLFACWCVRNTPIGDGRRVWDLLTDERSKRAVEVAERYARGEATDTELVAAWAAARSAANAVESIEVRSAAWSSAWEAEIKELTRILEGIKGGEKDEENVDS